ncbi:MAG: tetratricopeptide repeat protein, partial [Myxococcota bacterium]
MGYQMRCCRGLLLALLSMVVHSATLDADEPTPTTTTPEMERGLDALDSGHWASAMEIFQALSESQPDQPAATYYLGVSAAHEGNDVVAAEAFSKAAAIDPSYGWVQANLGLTFFRLGELKPAEDHLLEALLQGPDDADVLLHLGMIDEQRGEYDRALRLFEESADQDPEVAALAMLQAANLELGRGNLPAALDFLERARLAPGPTSSQQAADRLLAALAVGSSTPSRYSLRASAGFELDDNVTLSEQDLATGLADEALVLNAGLDIYLLRDEALWVSVGYDFYQSLYRTLTDFDRQIQQPRLVIGGKIGRFYPTFSYSYLNETLDGDGFLSSHKLDLDLDIALV